MLIVQPRASLFICRCYARRAMVKMVSLVPPHRENPIIMKLHSPEFRSIFTPELSTLTSLFKKHSYQLRVAGGAVRDVLMGMEPKDLDFATDATPDEMKKMFEDEGVRMINNRGEKHGTITARINDKQNFEVTTLRIDTATDGRHAVVKFTTDWLQDALRRDLTINSMFLDFNGNVYDYFYGYDDLMNKRVAFVGDAATRIKEDYLRIFRYFRFYGRISEKSDAHEEATINAIKENVDGLEQIAGERIWMELSKILMGNYAKDIMLKMLDCGVGKYMGLPSDPDINSFISLFSVPSAPVHSITYLSFLLSTEAEVLQMHERLKLSAFERDLAKYLIANKNTIPTSNILRVCKKEILQWKGNVKEGKMFILENLRVKGLKEVEEEFEKFTIPKFPINGYMLRELNVPRLAMGRVISELKEIWFDRNFEITTEQLMEEVPRILSYIDEAHPERAAR